MPRAPGGRGGGAIIELGGTNGKGQRLKRFDVEWETTDGGLLWRPITSTLNLCDSFIEKLIGIFPFHWQNCHGA